MNFLQERFEQETNYNIEVLFNTGRINIYQKWLKKLVKEQEKFLLCAAIPKTTDKIIYEITENRDYAATCDLPLPTYVIEAKREPFFYQPRRVPFEERLSGHFLCNGYYQEVGSFINQFLDKGSFTVGVCLEHNDKNYKKIKRSYQALYQELQKSGKCALSCQEKRIGDYKIYMLRGGRI